MCVRSCGANTDGTAGDLILFGGMHRRSLALRPLECRGSSDALSMCHHRLSQIFRTGCFCDRAICCKIDETCPIGWERWRKSTPHSLQDEIMIDGPPGSSQRPTGQSPPLLPACCAFPALYMRKQLARCEWFRVPRKFTRLAEARPCSESTTSESISKVHLRFKAVCKQSHSYARKRVAFARIRRRYFQSKECQSLESGGLTGV